MDKLEASLRNFEACTQRNHTYRWTREKCKFGPLWCNVGSKLRRAFSMKYCEYLEFYNHKITKEEHVLFPLIMILVGRTLILQQ